MKIKKIRKIVEDNTRLLYPQNIRILYPQVVSEIERKIRILRKRAKRQNVKSAELSISKAIEYETLLRANRWKVRDNAQHNPIQPL